MALSDTEREKIYRYVRSYILRTAENHGHQNAAFRANARWMHTLNVVQNLRQIWQGEKADEDVRTVTEIAAVFHDIDHYTVAYEYHALQGAETATRHLKKEGYDPEVINRVASAIREHNRDLVDDEPVEDQVKHIVETLSLEARMVMDADTLDKIGVSNILQAASSMSQTDKRQVWEIARELTAGWPLQRASAWKDLLTTETGKRVGEERFAFYEQFLKQVQGEVVMVDPYVEVEAAQT
jgi:hypothetical protein